MSIPKEMWQTLRELSALQARTEDVAKVQVRLENKLNEILERITRIEVQQEQMRVNIKNEIMADLKADLAMAQHRFQEIERSLHDDKPSALPDPDKND